jgi:NADPH:quinone reductase-like Zn-dependent oxidoreductase
MARPLHQQQAHTARCGVDPFEQGAAFPLQGMTAHYLLHEYNLAELVKGITSRNLHDEIDFSGPVGKEIW